MHKPQQQVQEFHRDVLKQPHSPADPQLRLSELRASLLLEEVVETVTALVGSERAYALLMDACANAEHLTGPVEPNIVEAIDGLCDVLVVAYGTAEAIGIDLEPFFDEVHRTNMAKANGPIRADGKLLKPPGWTPPDIAGVLARGEKETQR